MISYEVFLIFMFISIFFPIIVFIVIILLNFLDREINFLEIQNKKISLEKELNQSQFMQLNQQIQPHFLFNTLNVITSLGRLGRLNDCVKSLEKLSLFLKYNYLEKEALVSFERELIHTENYISIQKTRFGKNLQTEIYIDPKARNTFIPPYTLQTLVENAFKHGLEKKVGEKTLKIKLIREGNWVFLSVTDNGPTEKLCNDFSVGVGLNNLKKRFAMVFDMSTRLSLKRRNNLTEVKVIWPFTPEV